VERVCALDAPPRHLAISGEGAHVALDHGSTYEVRALDSGERMFAGDKLPGALLTMLSHSLLVDGREYFFSGERATMQADTGLVSGGVCWAIHFVGRSFVAAVSKPARRSRELPTIDVSARDFLRDDRRMSLLRWSERVTGTGCAAIAGDESVAVALHDRRFVVFEGRGGVATGGALRCEGALSIVPRDLAVIDGCGYALVGERERGPVLVALDTSGREIWWIALPAWPTQPPLDLGGGRVGVVLPHGVAAIEAGAVAWHRDEGSPHATALVDGSLVVASPSGLALVTREGASLGSLALSHGEAPCAAPAIGPDGAIVVATRHALYRTR
jgi:hypothetical protein